MNTSLQAATTQPESGMRFLQRRLSAAAIDAGIVAACCSALLASTGPLAVLASPTMRWLSGVVLGVYAAVEILTGRTPGKLLLKIRLVNSSGGAPQAFSVVGRGLIRLLPVSIFVLSLLVADPIVSLLLWCISLTLVCCYGREPMQAECSSRGLVLLRDHQLTLSHKC
jgi:uncharacterized RDD family membrane protein YckC